MLDKYLLSLQETYVISNKTISCDLSKFTSKETNVLLIAGISASGKSTLGKKLAKKLKAKYIQTDYPCSDEKANKQGHPIACYEHIFNQAIKSRQRAIIEGVLVYWSCLNENNQLSPFFQKMKHTPIILLGTSVFRSAIQGYKRGQGDISIRQAFEWYVKYGIGDMKAYKIFKEYRLDVPGTEVDEFKI